MERDYIMSEVDDEDIIDEVASLHKENAELVADYQREVKANKALQSKLQEIVTENAMLQRKVNVLQNVTQSFSLMIAGAQEVLKR